MLRNGEANPLTVHGLREMGHCPPHFVRVTFDPMVDSKIIKDWIYENLEGRFWMGDTYFTSSTGVHGMTLGVAFEIPAEATMFSLILDQINSHTNSFL